MKSIFTLSALVIVAGCGGSGSESGPTTLTFLPAVSNVGGFSQNITYDAATDTYAANLRGGTILLDRDSAYDNGTFLAAQGSGATEQYGLYSSETDQSRVVLFRPDPADISDGPAVILGRLSDATIPTSGTAVLTGDYQALIQPGTAQPVTGLVDGDATLDINFANRTISGIVTNRLSRDPADGTFNPSRGTYADLTLKPAVYDDVGAFSTDTEGGAITVSPFAFPLTAFEVTGTYRGLLAGDGDEAVIGVTVLHNLGGGGVIEVGAIAAGH